MSKHSTLGNGEWLMSDNSLFSPDGNVEFKMQTDGKVCVYKGGACTWQSSPSQVTNAKGVIMQDDGNLCIYTNENPTKCIWQSDTAQKGNTTSILTVQNDGNIVIYNGTPIWATNTKS